MAGIGRVHKEAYPDHFAWKKGHKYFDPRSTPDKPVWMMVDIEFCQRLPTFVGLPALKENPALDGLMVIKKGSRLSVQPVDEGHFKEICRMGGVEKL